MNSQEVIWASAITKKAPATPQYRGPLTSRKPVLMKNVQDWMVDPMILQHEIANCKRNHNPPFTPETISTLKKRFHTTLKICSRSDVATDDTEPETQES